MPMKKLVVIIIILLIVFIGMYIYRQNQIETNRNNEITVDEINKIETYLQKIYMCQLRSVRFISAPFINLLPGGKLCLYT